MKHENLAEPSESLRERRLSDEELRRVLPVEECYQEIHRRQVRRREFLAARRSPGLFERMLAALTA